MKRTVSDRAHTFGRARNRCIVSPERAFGGPAIVTAVCLPHNCPTFLLPSRRGFRHLDVLLSLSHTIVTAILTPTVVIPQPLVQGNRIVPKIRPTNSELRLMPWWTA